MMEMKNLVLCDIDDTLFRSNTTFDFLEYATKSRWMLRTKLRFLTRRWSPIFLLLTALGSFVRRDIVRERSLRLLAGLESKQTAELASAFYDDWLSKRLNSEVWALVCRDHASDRYLVSSTLDPVATVIATRLGVRYRSSVLEVINGRLTGRLASDLKGRKQEFARELKRLYPAARLVVITDNRSDRDLVEMADERYVIINKESDKSFWSDLRPSYLHG
jgi:phosphoserine phosphatase